MTKKTDTPAIRFKGFSDTWEQRKFGEVFDCTVPNNTLSRAELSYDEGTVLNVHYGDVLIKYGSVLDVQKDDIPRIPHRCREDFNGALLQDGDVIIADTAEDETTGKACEIGNLQGSAIVSGLHTMVCRPRNRMALGYLGYYLNSNAYHYQLLPLMQGIKVLSLSRSNIQKTSVSYPSAMKEQQLIASYFSQLDHLITLHQRKCKIRNLRCPKSTAITWEQRKLGDCFAERVESMPDGELISVTINDGIKKFSELGRHDNSNDDKSKYKKVCIGDIAYNSMRMWQGASGYSPYEGIVSPAYTVLSPNSGINSKCLAYQFKLPEMIHTFQINSQGITSDNWNLKYPALSEIEIFVSRNEKEQAKIAEYFEWLDRLITLHQRELYKYLRYQILKVRRKS